MSIAIGAVVGLVAITPVEGYVDAMKSTVIGLVGEELGR